jgi:hypothetical protein
MAWREDNRRRSNGEQYLLASMRHWYIPRAGLGRSIGNAFEGSRMIRMRALLAVIVFFGLATCAQATAIIAFWSPDAVYIGADSRETSPNQAPREICKIRIAGDVVVAEAGWLEDINDGIVVESIDKVIKTNLVKVAAYLSI